MTNGNTVVSAVGHAKDTSCRAITLGQALQAIRGGKYQSEVGAVRAAYRAGGKDRANPLKVKLPAILFSGEFTARNSSSCVSHSGLIIADYDALDECDGLLEKTRAALSVSPHAYAVFLSPTGSGLKALFRVPASIEAHKANFALVAEHCRQLTGLEIDKSGSDICRPCFISSDPNLFLNPDATELSSQCYREIETLRYGDVETSKRLKLSPPSVAFGDQTSDETESAETGLTADRAAAEIAKHGERVLPQKRHGTNDKLFQLARLAKQFESDVGRPLSLAELDVLFSTWIRMTNATDPNYLSKPKSEYRADFLAKCDSARLPIGESPLARAMELSESSPPPKEAEQFADSPALAKLTAVCWHLSRMSVEGPSIFYLSSVEAAKVAGVTPMQANRYLRGLCASRGGILELVEVGTMSKRRASRYRWKGTPEPMANGGQQ